MRRSYKIDNLGCADCASKMERDINKLDGVNKATISFMTCKLLLDADDESFDSILDSACAICKSYEPDCEVLV